MTVIALATAYPCKSGGPVLRAVDMVIFTLRYFTRCMACTFCRDSCCQHGVDVDLENAARLKALPQAFHDRIGLPDSAWFTDLIVEDAEFPGGRHVRTQIRDGACVFLNRGARGCHIHAYALETGMDYHDVKPLVSTLFPATFEQGVLVVSAEVADGSLICAGEGPSVYAGARDELLYYFGPELVAELDVMQEKAGRADG